MKRIFIYSMVWAGLVNLMGCGGDSTSETGGAPGAVDKLSQASKVEGAPVFSGEEPKSDVFMVGGYAQAMASHGDEMALGTSTSVYEVTAAGPVLLSITGDEPDLPAETGSVRAMSAYDGGILVAAEQGLFFAANGKLGLSPGHTILHPLEITALSAREADDDGNGTAETHVLFIASDGAYEIENGMRSKWTVEGETGIPTAIYGQKDRLYIAFGSRVYEIDKAANKAYALGFDMGDVREIACNSRSCQEGSLIYFASDKGLFARSGDGAYIHYSLAAKGEASPGVMGFALDAGKQRLYAFSKGMLLRVRDGEIPDRVATLEDAGALVQKAAVDKLGDVWVGEGQQVHRYGLGTPLSFATDIKPIMHEYCAECHATGTKGAPIVDFEDYNVAVERLSAWLGRVKAQTMPPVSYPKKLPGEKIQVMEDWSVMAAP